jgi:hypothetical protein
MIRLVTRFQMLMQAGGSSLMDKLGSFPIHWATRYPAVLQAFIGESLLSPQSN